MTRILHRDTRHAYPVAASAVGVMIRDAAGNEYLDASAGAAVSCLGHSHPDVLAAMREQLDRLAYAHTGFFTSQVAEELAEDLVAHAPSGMGHVFFVSGGSEAVEAALKLARQYFVERDEQHRLPDRTAPELSRRNARRACCRWSETPTPGFRSTSNRDASCIACLRISWAAR